MRRSLTLRTPDGDIHVGDASCHWPIRTCGAASLSADTVSDAVPRPVSRSRRGSVLTIALFAALAAVVAFPLNAGAGERGDVAVRAGSDADGTRSKPGRLIVRVRGLPLGTRPAVSVRGRGLARSLRSRKLTITNARPGRYVVAVRRVTISRGRSSVKRGARAFPRKKRLTVRVRSGKRTVASVRYGTIINPGVARAPHGLLSVVGDPASPDQLIYAGKQALPSRGQILTAVPSRILPAGLIVKITKSERRGNRQVLSVVPVPFTDAVPAFDFTDALALTAAHDRNTARAARSCDGPKEFDFGAKLDDVKLRRASWNASWRQPQMSFTVAIRSTEWFGPRVAAAGVSCKWTLKELGPWRGAIVVSGIPIPWYVTIPIDVAANVEGSLSAFKVNLASTSVLSLDLGDRNNFSFSQEGSNVWIDGALQGSGKARFSATLNLRFGVGDPKVGNLHLNAAFGPRFSWQSGVGCDVAVDLGALSAGVKIPRVIDKGTPAWAPFFIPLWRGCDGSKPGPGPGPGPVPPPQPPAPGPGPGPVPPPQPPAGAGRMMIINGSFAAYAKDSLSPGGWVQQTPTADARAVAVGADGRMMIINGCGAAYAKDSLEPGGWTQQSPCGDAQHVAVGGPRMMIINGCGAAYAKDSISPGGWAQQTPCGDARAVAVGAGGRMMIINGSDTAYAKDSLSPGGWVQQTPTADARAVAVGASGRMMIINGCGAAYAKDSLEPGGWTQQTPCSDAKQIDVG